MQQIQVGHMGLAAQRRRFLVLGIALLLLLLRLAGANSVAYAQAPENARSYTVLPGDTLFEIAQQVGIPLQTLIDINGIENPDRLEIGQVLLFPNGESGPPVISVPASAVRARPGDTVLSLSKRYGQELSVITSLNTLSNTVRLFPGQSIYLPMDGRPTEPLRFGAVEQVETPEQLIQGRTGRVYVDSRRPVELAGSWNGLPIVFTPLPDNPLRQYALLPVPALLAPAPYSVVISYTSGNGLSLDKVWTVAVVEGDYDQQEINLPPDRGALLDPALVQAELAKVVSVWGQTSPELLWSAPFARPIDIEYSTTSPFGTRRSYNGGPYNSYHAGQDFGAPAGITVTVPAAGIVALAEPLDIRGNAAIIDHGRGVFSGYWHLGELSVTAGQEVSMGDVLGFVGNSGLSTGAHLHWELRIYGIAVDPLQFLDESIAE